MAACRRTTRALAAPLLAAAAAACVALGDPPPPQPLTEAGLRATIAELAIDGTSPIVVAVGDIARCDALEPARATAALAAAVLAAAPSAAVITVGDHAYESATAENLERCYGPTWGRFNEITYPSPGNHDLEAADGAAYYDYFARYARDPDARARGYYAFEIGEWRLLSLNSLLPLERGSEQLRWLEEQLARSRRRCTLAYWHHPRMSSGWHGLWPWDKGRDTKDAWRLLAEHDAELVVSGHDHIYERFEPLDASLEPDALGIRQFVVGTGGGRRQPVIRRRATSAFLYEEGYGVLVLELHPSAYEWSFVAADGRIRDRAPGPVPCH